MCFGDAFVEVWSSIYVFSKLELLNICFLVLSDNSNKYWPIISWFRLSLLLKHQGNQERSGFKEQQMFFANLYGCSRW